MTFSDSNFDKAHKVDNKTEAGSSMHGKMADIIKTNFDFRKFKTALQNTVTRFLVPSNCDLKVPLVKPELCRIITCWQKERDLNYHSEIICKSCCTDIEYF